MNLVRNSITSFRYGVIHTESLPRMWHWFCWWMIRKTQSIFSITFVMQFSILFPSSNVSSFWFILEKETNIYLFKLVFCFERATFAKDYIPNKSADVMWREHVSSSFKCKFAASIICHTLCSHGIAHIQVEPNNQVTFLSLKKVNKGIHQYILVIWPPLGIPCEL